MRMSELFGAKSFGFFDDVCARTRKSLSQCGHFADKERRDSIFCDFVRTSFPDGS